MSEVALPVRQYWPVEITSRLAADCPTVWARVTTLEGVNAELAPWLRMTGPWRSSDLDLARAPLNRPWVVSWVLAVGLIPIDRHVLGLERLEPPRGFREHSWSLLHRDWIHERSLDPLPNGGCQLTDRVAFSPRVPLLGELEVLVVGAIFRHRHHRLRAVFGTAD